MKKQILFFALLLCSIGALAQTPVTTRRVNTESIVERKSEFGVEMIGAIRVHDSIWLYTTPEVSSPDYVLSIDTTTGLVNQTSVSDLIPSDTTYPDSSVLFVGSNRVPTTDSSLFNYYLTSALPTHVLGNKVNTLESGGIITQNYRIYQNSGAPGFGIGMANSAGGTGGVLNFYRSRGSLASPSVPTTATPLGQIRWGGYNGTTWVASSAYMLVVPSNTWSASTYETNIEFGSTAPNSTTPIAVVNINKAKSLSILGGRNDTLYTLSVVGTAAITQTPENTDFGDSILTKNDTTGQIKAISRLNFAMKNDTNTFEGIFINTTPEIPDGASSVSFLVTDPTTQVQSLSFDQGVYLPVDSAESNTDGVVPDTAFYTRVGNVVTVSGVIEIDPTVTLTPTFFYVNLPVFPANWAVNRAGGTFDAYIVNEGGAVIMAGPTSVLFQYLPTATGANNFSYTYSYRIQ